MGNGAAAQAAGSMQSFAEMASQQASQAQDLMQQQMDQFAEMHVMHNHPGAMAPTDGIFQAARMGDQNAREMFFQKLATDIRDRKLQNIMDMFKGWPEALKLPDTHELVVDAVEKDDLQLLSAFLLSDVDLGYLHSMYDKPLTELNPIILGLKCKSWKCMAELTKVALEHDYSREKLQTGLYEFVVEGDVETVERLVQDFKIPCSCQVLCTAQLLAPKEVSHKLLNLLSPTVTDFNVKSTVVEKPDHIGWSNFTPIHAACMASHVCDDFIELLIDKKVDMSQWGQKLPKRPPWGRPPKTKQKRLPLHYAAANGNIEDQTVVRIAQSFPAALFEPVGGKTGNSLPCQLARSSEDRQKALEQAMYKHICKHCDELQEANVADLFHVIRLVIQFEAVRTIDNSELSRGKAGDLIASQLQKLIDASQEEAASRTFVQEAEAFAKANPRVDLGRESANKVEVKSIATMGEILKSDFWELLQLVNAAEKVNKSDFAAQVPQLEKMLAAEISARLKWASQQCSGEESESLSTSDVVRYALFIVAGLIAAQQSQGSDAVKRDEGGEKEDDDTVEEESKSKDPSNLAKVAFEAAVTDLETIVDWYCKDLQIPSTWNLLDLLKQGLSGDGAAFDCVFAGGDLVIKQRVEAEHPQYKWMEGLFDQTFLHIYTRDRHGEDVPKSLKVHSVEQVFNCGSWGEYAKQRKLVAEELSEKGAAWMEDLKPDVCLTHGEAPTWHLLDDKSAANEHWLYHGTSLAGETGITEGDFRLNLAGSNAGTLYGNGVYLAEAVSKSDEYTTPHGDDVRSILVCLASLGRVNYNDEKHPDGDELANSCKGGGFNSILGDREKIRGTYREIVVFNENQIYPAYICHYKRCT